MAGPRQRHRLRALPRRLALGRPRAHPPRPVLVVAVADDERERRPERAPVPEPGEHLDLVLLELLARAAAVALLAPAQVGVDRGAVERRARRAGRSGSRRARARATRRRWRGASVTPAERTAARITSTGAGTPVQSSNDAAPCATRTSSPSTTARRLRARRRRAPSRCSRGTAGRRAVWPGRGSNEHLVPHRRRVDDEVGVARLRRPVAAAREDALRAAAPRARRTPPPRRRRR